MGLFMNPGTGPITAPVTDFCNVKSGAMHFVYRTLRLDSHIGG
jgi:hypothetical protein